MNAMTPRGTRTREISMPFGRRHDSATVPTGSGSAAIWRRPLAISSMRASESVRRSRKARVRPWSARAPGRRGCLEEGGRLLLERACHLRQRLVLHARAAHRERVGSLARGARFRLDELPHVHCGSSP